MTLQYLKQALHHYHPIVITSYSIHYTKLYDVRMEDALQATKGVVIPEVKLAETKYANNDWKLIDAKVRPEAGYMVIAPENLTFNYRPYRITSYNVCYTKLLR